MSLAFTKASDTCMSKEQLNVSTKPYQIISMGDTCTIQIYIYAVVQHTATTFHTCINGHGNTGIPETTLTR